MTLLPSNKIAREDIKDLDIVDAIELASDGYSSFYRTINIASTTSGTKQVVISPASAIDILSGSVDEPIESGDYVHIFGNAATGIYTVDSILNITTFTVLESIVSSTDGYAHFIHPSGASRVGVDNTNLTFTTSSNVQDVFEDLNDNLMPNPTEIGQLLYAADSDNLVFNPERPIINDDGFILVNDDDVILVV